MRDDKIFDMPVHPAAEVFPMLSSDELAELAEDMLLHGQRLPIIVKDGVLIDGRNRREACRLAGIAPRVEELNGEEPVAFILSTNIARRHLTKGQRAMAVARICPETHQGKRATSSESDEVSGTRLRMARAVLKWAPEMADAVLAGATGLDAAYALAQERKIASEAPQRRLDMLRATDPDLADKVVEGDLVLADAEGAARDRRQRERDKRTTLHDGLKRIGEWRFLIHGANARFLVQTCRDHPDELSPDTVRALFDELAADIDAIRKELLP